MCTSNVSVALNNLFGTTCTGKVAGCIQSADGRIEGDLLVPVMVNFTRGKAPYHTVPFIVIAAFSDDTMSKLYTHYLNSTMSQPR